MLDVLCLVVLPIDMGVGRYGIGVVMNVLLLYQYVLLILHIRRERVILENVIAQIGILVEDLMDVRVAH